MITILNAMRRLGFISLVAGLGAIVQLNPAHAAPPACPELLQRELPRLQDEKPQALCQYAGRVVLVVNTASFCGFTSQYKALEAKVGKSSKVDRSAEDEGKCRATL